MPPKKSLGLQNLDLEQWKHHARQRVPNADNEKNYLRTSNQKPSKKKKQMVPAKKKENERGNVAEGAIRGIVNQYGGKHKSAIHAGISTIKHGESLIGNKKVGAAAESVKNAVQKKKWDWDTFSDLYHKGKAAFKDKGVQKFLKNAAGLLKATGIKKKKK